MIIPTQPAFPQDPNPDNKPWATDHQVGLTKLEYYAGEIFAQMFGDKNWVTEAGKIVETRDLEDPENNIAALTAKNAVRAAAELIKALQAEQRKDEAPSA